MVEKKKGFGDHLIFLIPETLISLLVYLEQINHWSGELY